MKFAFYTLGCKTNQYETQAMERLLLDMGHEIGRFEDDCDGYIINTCSVTAVADKKNRAVIRRCRKNHPEALIAVCGCYSQHASDAVQHLGVDLIGGSAGRAEFVQLLVEAATASIQSLRTGAAAPPPPAFTRGVARSAGGSQGLLLGEKLTDVGNSAPHTRPCGPPSPQGEGMNSALRPAQARGTPLVNAGGEGGEAANLATITSVDTALKRRTFEILPAGGLEERTRAMLKVQDGCVNFCSYCIIPYTRGPIRSAPLETAVAQAKELAERGYKEIVLTGIEIASWGQEWSPKRPMTELVAAICEAVPQVRIRLGSLEPRIITEEFCRDMAKFPNLCPQFHLSMQSGCDTVLARMKRKYDTARYLKSVQLLKSYFPGCAVTTDMIVAFPGESEEEFAESLAFIQQCGFADMHIFPYSRRPGTPADKMPGQHDNTTKETRSRAAIAIADKMSRAYRESLIGSVQAVLFEEAEGEFFTGHAPNYSKVYAPGENLHNEICQVRMVKLHKDGLLGEIL